MDRDRSDSTWGHVERPRDGIVIKKRVRVRDNSDPKHVIDLSVMNETTQDVLIGVSEELPDECALLELSSTNKDSVSWFTSPSDGKLKIQLVVITGEERTITYWPGTSNQAVLHKICQQPFAFAGVKDAARGDEYVFDETSSDGSHRSEPQSRADAVSEDNPHINSPPERDFSDVVGLHEIKRDLYQDVIDPFLDPRYDEYDIGKANGVFFYGPPGTGKTYLATALAGELEYNFFNVDVADIRRSKLGESVQNLDRIFELAEENQPCVLFFDEIDSLAPDRDPSTHQARIEVVNQLLTHVEEINEQDADILIIAATNRPDVVDDALLRTGRFDTQFKIGMPDEETRLALLEHEMKTFDGQTPDFWTDRAFMDRFVEKTRNFAASDIVELAESAQRASLQQTSSDEEPIISTDLLLEQVDDIDDDRETTVAGEFLVENPDLDFSDVGGMDAVKERLSETLLEPLSNTDLYDTYGLDVSNGVLLHGPPGTGKTYLSRALAGEADCSFLSITAADIVSKWIGEASENIQELFETAERVAPAVVLIDEIDAIASDRGSQMTNSEQQAVNELLAQISKLEIKDVFVVGTTNRLDIVDRALTRAGRLGETIEIPPPSGKTRLEILRTQLTDRPVEIKKIDWDTVEQMTKTGPGTEPYVASDLAKIADEAARYAMEEADSNVIQPIRQRHLRRAILKTPPSLVQSTDHEPNNPQTRE